MPELLTGTVTFFFSDIEGSTQLLRAQGAGWGSLLERHHQLLREAFAANGGEEVGTEGDSFFVAFPTAPGAVAAAVQAQRALAAEPWPEGAEIRVRIGLHTGEASFSAKTYVGLHVHRASRIASVGHGGQVLLSSETRALVGRSLPDGVELRDLGEHRLKDLEHPEHLWQLVIPDLRSDFAPIASLEATPNNLPTRLTTFLGREREIGEVGELLETHRLLTLTGPGGTGKTRLSLEVASRMMARFPDGVYFVELASITDPELVLPTIAQALNLPDRGGRTIEERLIDYLGERRLLLVLDNFEQVLDAAAAVGRLLAAASNLAVLTSSRSALQISGEQEYPVPPLGLPDPSRLPPLAQLSQYEAVALFIERARAVKPAFEVTNENAPAVAEICVRLDGLPLAIELAAARIRILAPQAMLGRLSDRLGLLSGGSRDLPERQQTLRGAIGWSHELLDDTDRALFAGLSVFVGGAALAQIERVCGDEITGEVLDTLASLVEKSLLRQTDGADGEPRFTMLETIREFAEERSIERGRREVLRRAHAQAFADFASEAAGQVMGHDKRAWLDRLEDEHDNLRAAIGWAIETGEAELALRVTASLWRFWQMRGYLAEALERLEAVLAMPGAGDHAELRADALDAVAGVTYWQADAERSRAYYEQEIELRRALGDRAGLAQALYGISFTWSIRHPLEIDPAASRMAVQTLDQALEIFRELRDEGGIGRCEWALANIQYSDGNVAEAVEHARRALEVFERMGDDFMIGWSTFTVALGAIAEDIQSGAGSQAKRDEARDWLKRSLQIFSEAQDVSGYTLVIDTLGLVAYRSGDTLRGARLSGAVRNLERITGTGLNFWNRGVLDYEPEIVYAAPELMAAVAEGEAWSLEEAVAYALEG
ncbi:MAG TPA: adenylate/guanylate cyclase domain-containing protein [Candidatus Limnocylindria bacterium]|nr:adenylate/guanylate cyclase domain-containing protein [Candidatus Limnocylindria bacterium]